jgi:hypothetical protein
MWQRCYNLIYREHKTELDVDGIIQLIDTLNNDVVSVTGVKSIVFLLKFFVLGYASCDNSSPLGGKDALFSLDAQITVSSLCIW